MMMKPAEATVPLVQLATDKKVRYYGEVSIYIN